MARKSYRPLFISYYLFFILTNLQAKVINRKHLLFHFDKIEISGEISAFIQPGKRNREIEILADQEIIDSIGFRVSNRTLFLEANNTFKIKRRIPFIGLTAVRSFPVEVLVRIDSLDEVKVFGESNLSLNEIKSEKFKLHFESSGKAVLNELKCSDLTLLHRGTGEISLRGTRVNQVDLKISGSGDLRAEELFIDQAKVMHYGSGLVTISPNLWLDAKILGSGNIRLLEKPDGMVIHREEGAGKLIQDFE